MPTELAHDESFTVIQSYVFRENAAWFVSTINRASSATLGWGRRYHETLVWAWDPKTRGREQLLWSGEDIVGAITTHVAVCRRLYETGNPEEHTDADD